MTDQTDVNSVMYSTFVGNMVLITTTVNQTNRIQLPDGIMTETLPIFVEGILMDIDDENYYLGDGQNVSNFVNRQLVLQMELKEEENKFKKLLESVNPRDETDFN